MLAGRRRRRAPRPAPTVTRRERRRARPRGRARPGRPVLGGVRRSPPACSSRARASLVRDCGVNWTRTGFLRIVQRMGGIVLGDLEEQPGDERPARASRSATSTSPRARSWAPSSSPTRSRWRSTSCRSSALLGCFAEGETVVRGAAGAAAQGVRPDRRRSSTGCAGSAPTSRPRTTASSCAGPAACGAGAIDARGDHRLAMLGAVAGLASREGVEVDGHGRGGRVLPSLHGRPVHRCAEPETDARRPEPRPQRPCADPPPAAGTRAQRRARRIRTSPGWKVEPSPDGRGAPPAQKPPMLPRNRARHLPRLHPRPARRSTSSLAMVTGGPERATRDPLRAVLPRPGRAGNVQEISSTDRDDPGRPQERRRSSRPRATRSRSTSSASRPRSRPSSTPTT